jgi:predicted AAA+ superfamily ATPase
MADNHLKITQGFRSLLEGMAPYVARELHIEFGKNWWQEGVLDMLYDDQKRNLPASGEWVELVDSLDILSCLTLFADVHWQGVFRKKLSIDHRTWAIELKGFRHKVAHIGGEDFSDDDTWRALDTMSRLAEQIDPDGAEQIRTILRTLRYGSAEGSTAITQNGNSSESVKTGKKAGILETTPLSGLLSWREVMEPHPDVAQGRYKNAEFAADLAQVARGEGSFEYRDPVEFFARTYVTEGMAGLLTEALKRVSGKDGEPVIQLKTAFGGGKTHSMLALYHMMRGKVSIEKLPNLKPVLNEAGYSTLPKVNVAVVVGTALDPNKAKRPSNMPGITINTIWGEIAAQLAEAKGDPSLYDYVKEADKKGVSPGSEALKNLFDAAAPSMVLMDELVAYAKKLYGASGLVAGSYDNFIAFIQEISEAARASKNSLVVASIPESELEIGGEAGKLALDTIEHTFGRMESIWKPVAASEGFEVVRRRLFLDCKNPDMRDEVCRRFSQMYLDNASDFPSEAKEVEYRNRMLGCYPIHPEVFDRLYEDWSTLDRFQRTRGVLRLMAAVIHELWMGNDAGLMIMPGSIPLDVPNVRDELTRYLSEGWNSVVDSEVDGKNSTPYRQDQQVKRFGQRLVSRRVARTIMLGSAPSDRTRNIKGLEASRIRLGTVQPGETIALFNDALSSLNTSLTYLYSNASGDRFWYDTRPTLRKTVEDRATQLPLSDVEYEIESRLRKLRREPPLAGIHICPGSSLDVPDEQSSRLVILRPTDVHKDSKPSDKAMVTVDDILNFRGNSQRIYRNMLVFVAADKEAMVSLQENVKLYLAWKSIKEDSVELNLDAAQNRETEANLNRSNQTVDDQMAEAYSWLLVPYIDKSADTKEIVWERARIGGGSEGVVVKAARKLIQDEHLIQKWAPTLLKMELDNLLWKDENHISVKQLWDYLSSYAYLPRLASEDVLIQTIQQGVNSQEYFAYAAGFDGERYLDLKLDQSVGSVDRSGYLVKVPVAKDQLAKERAAREQEEGGDVPMPATSPEPTGVGMTGEVETTGESPAQPQVNKTRFYLSARLDNTRINRDVQKLLEEVIKHLSDTPGAEVKVSLEVEASSMLGFSATTVRTVSENSRTLRVDDFGFDD